MFSPARVVLRNRYDKTPDGAVRVVRPSDFGNPFRVTRPKGSPHYVVLWRGRRRSDPAPVPEWADLRFGFLDRATAHVCAEVLYERWLLMPEQAALRTKVIAELKGKDLACMCPPDLHCHATPLLRVANGIKRSSKKLFRPPIKLTEPCPIQANPRQLPLLFGLEDQ